VPDSPQADPPFPPSQPPLSYGGAGGFPPPPPGSAAPYAAPAPQSPEPGGPVDHSHAVGEPAWAAWQGLLGLFAWVVGTFVVGSIVVVAAAATGLANLDTDRLPPGILIAATVAGDLVFLAVPLGFAAITARPRAWHFGFRRARFWPTVGWAVLALFGWFVFSAIYQALVDPQGSQSTADDLGVNRNATLLILGGFVVIVLAPIVEEFFFRGFIYRTLRNGAVRKLGLAAGIGLAAALDGLLFGLVHATNTPIAILPVLAVLGAAFCLVYERTGSLFAVIWMHATVNMFGYVFIAKNSAPVALGFWAAMMVGCIVVPRLLRGDDRPAESPALS
jgi:membrane protease YdiL (CAAX protease family)